MEEAEVASKSKRVVELEQRVHADQYDIDAWTDLLRLASGIDAVSKTYESFLHVFPTSGRHWQKYAHACVTAGDVEKAGEVLGRAIQLENTDMDLWMFYVRYVSDNVLKSVEERWDELKKRATSDASVSLPELRAAASAVMDARIVVGQAFELAVSKVGSAINAGVLWREFLAFLKRAPEENLSEQSLRRDLLRKAYHRVIQMAIKGVDEFWKEYCDFERAESQPTLATGLIAKHQSNYATAIAAYNDKRRTWDHLSLETLARPMEHVAAGAASDAVVKARRLKIDEQIGLWHDALGYEKENRQHLEPPALAERVRLVYRQALNCLRFLPDMWLDLAHFERANGDVIRAELALTTGMQVLPQSQLLGFAAADFYEMLKHNEQATAVYERLVKDSPSSLVYILYMRFARRVSGIGAARQVFKRARMSEHCTQELFIASAQLEMYANRLPDVARKVLEVGRKKYPESVSFAVAALDLTIPTADDSNTRVLFQTILGSFPPHLAKPIWDRYLLFELTQVHSGGGEAALAAVAALEARRAELDPSSTSLRPLVMTLHRYHCYGMSPSAPEDSDYFRRQPWSGSSAIHSLADAMLPPAAGAGAGSGSAAVAPGAQDSVAQPPAMSGGGDSEIPSFLRRVANLLPKNYTGPRNKVDFVIRRLRSVPVPQPPTSSASGSHKRRMDDDRDDSMHPPRSLARGDAVDVYTARMQQQNFGYRGKVLVEELRRSDVLSAYNEEGVRSVIDEMKGLSDVLTRTLESGHFNPEDHGLLCSMVIRDQSVLRNKRYLLAYLQRRLERIEDIRHDHGAVLPADTLEKLSSKEVDYFKQYDSLLTGYMRAVHLDLTADMQPPKHLLVEVRVLEDYGDIMTSSGPVILKKDEYLLLRRTDVEHLIRQGVLQETAS